MIRQNSSKTGEPTPNDQDPESTVITLDHKSKDSQFRVISRAKSRFEILIGFKPNEKKPLVMKNFPYKKGSIDPAFFRELRFADLSHPNLISIYEAYSNSPNTGEPHSSLIMEYAPHGDFLSLTDKGVLRNDPVLARTLFRQLVDGIEYIHNKGYAHMDLKLENILLGENYEVKLVDFDLSGWIGEGLHDFTGTKNYRAPEIKNGKCVDLPKADIYSLGILAFTFNFGMLPYREDKEISGHDLYEILMETPKKFFAAFQGVQKGGLKVDDKFKNLFLSMVAMNPKERATIKDIKASKWYNEKIYTKEEVRKKMVALQL